MRRLRGGDGRADAGRPRRDGPGLVARLAGPAARCRPGLLAGADAPLATPAAKAALWRDAGAAAVDMETHAAALAARRHGLRSRPAASCSIRLAHRAAAALAGLDTGGIWPVLRALARGPGQVAAVCVLAGEAWVARRALLRARARLGAGLGCHCSPSSLPPSSLL
ncbi:hypothetical protein [Massilia sp. CT11-137]|uniref:phosphorylase family protein n=1 Tax=Massilia sp. CT11-137 TaxID=3393901 RepID=UPI0039AF928A